LSEKYASTVASSFSFSSSSSKSPEKSENENENEDDGEKEGPSGIFRKPLSRKPTSMRCPERCFARVIPADLRHPARLEPECQNFTQMTCSALEKSPRGRRLP